MRTFIIDLTRPCLTSVVSVFSLPNYTCTFRTSPHPVCYVSVSGFPFPQRPSSFSIGLLYVLLIIAVFVQSDSRPVVCPRSEDPSIVLSIIFIIPPYNRVTTRLSRGIQTVARGLMLKQKNASVLQLLTFTYYYFSPITAKDIPAVEHIYIYHCRHCFLFYIVYSITRF